MTINPVAQRIPSLDRDPSLIDTGEPSVEVARQLRVMRSLILSERGRLSDVDRQRVARGLCSTFMDLFRARFDPCVGMYVSRRDDLGTALLREALRGRRTCVVLPIPTGHGDVRWRPDVPPGAGHRESHRHWYACPDEVRPSQLEIVVVPALAVDTRGAVLERDGDHYDRVLDRLGSGCLVLAAVHDSEVLDVAVEPIPEEPHGIRVDAVITPTRILHLSAERERTAS
jgi:5-formyltetrahydrofolate cyclo-ligase